jgi:hypothetical protein
MEGIPHPGGVRRLSRKDWAIISCGALVVVASFLPREAGPVTGLPL